MKKSPPPPWRFIFRHPSHFIACGMGSGLSPVAPGTAGTLFAWLTYPLLQVAFGHDNRLFAIFLAVAFVYGVLACDRAGRALGVADHGAIVWDEIVPFWFVLFMTPPGLLWQLGAFLLFRIFDIIKPPPARQAERLPAGWGILTDDLFAGLYANLVGQLLWRATPLASWLGLHLATTHAAGG